MIYLVTILFLSSFVLYQKYQFINGRSGQWHTYGLIMGIFFFVGLYIYKYFPFHWTDMVLCVAIYAVLYPIGINVIALKQKWNYIGTTSEFDKKFGKKQWWVYFSVLIFSIVLKIIYVSKKSKK